ncbi:DUF177 domain-containing protein [Paenibacillus spiritus]|uniref:DUF177 domain-containing protein n=1 Tax=Paenibacillus spiritus TaxID=2496557 RepID=A0A5J5G8R2_9BACL|nr:MULTISPECIES: DUF177 domain-containing protein [Paenibacillus]KAA9004138.1 DUF177 domain-containing protein [Paenibacillus spiritus]
MKFYFRKIANADGALPIHGDVDVSAAVKGRKDIVAVSPIKADLNALPAGTDRVSVAGKLHGEVDMLCARCLNPVKTHLDIPFAETFRWTKQAAEPAEEEEDEERIDVSEEMVDLEPYVEESFLLHLPLSVLCADDCRGLCPTCGSNLNEGGCDCDNVVIDPRLAGLKDFFKN